MPASRLVFLFLIAETSAIFFGGGGGGCGCNCCQPPAPPPTCSCPPPVPAPSCNSAPPVPLPPPAVNYAVPPPPPPPIPASYPISGPVPPSPSRDTYTALSAGTHSQSASSSAEVDATSQEKVSASSFSNEPVPISIEKPAPPKFDDYLPPAPPRSSSRSRLNFKTKADADDYEILSNSGFRRKPQKRSRDTKCVNEQLRRVILKCISQASSTEEARIRISTTAKQVFGYNFDVICAEKAFISTVNSDLFCELSIDDIFCLAFQH